MILDASNLGKIVENDTFILELYKSMMKKWIYINSL